MSKARDLASAAPAPAGVTSTELGYVDGVTSAIQTQLDAKTAKSTLTTTGDIYYASAANTPARLGIGTASQLLAVNSGATAPEWVTPSTVAESLGFTAGKNKIINGDFRINQRAFTSTTTATYGFDRFVLSASDGTVTYTPQTFTPGAAPVAGYEAINFAQIETTGQTSTTAIAGLIQRIEDVRTLAGQTATVSFYAKANSGTPNILAGLNQNFGSGGSPSAVVVTVGTVQAITTSWARYSFTIAVPSISGKTIGTTGNTSFLAAAIYVSGGSTSNAPTVGIQSNTFQIWGVQVEAGSTATAFQTATGTIQGELAACQRYYYRAKAGSQSLFGGGQAYSTTNSTIIVPYPVQMRITPTALEQSGTASHYGVYKADGSLATCSAVPAQSSLGNTENQGLVLSTVSSGLTGGNSAPLASLNSNAFLGWSAEL